MSYWFYALGVLAQLLFSARMLIQWIMSEKAKRVLSPTVFWQLSLLGSILLSLYGWLRGDFAIVLGQFISYYIYIWNLNIKGAWKPAPKLLRVIILLIPVCALLYSIYDFNYMFDQFDDVPLGLVIFGVMAQILFTFRFVYQWLYSRSVGKSVLPLNFWLISIVGSLMIVAYASFRKDPVLILGQGIGLITYSRNAWLIVRYKNNNTLKQ